jgi:hypothetical protein
LAQTSGPGVVGTTGALISSIVIVVVVVTVLNTNLTLSGPLATETATSAGGSGGVGLGQWAATTSYPTQIWTESCVSSSSDVYCIGGLNSTSPGTGVTNSAYYAAISGSQLGSWVKTTGYPTQIREESCVLSGSTIYCVGGYTPADVTDQVYYASISSSGIGAWANTTSYPTPVWGHSCVATSTDVYCVGGMTSSAGAPSNTTAVYFAPIVSNGLGQWQSTTSYPIGVLQHSCFVNGGDVYCVGGLGQSSDEFAPISSSGIGAWNTTTPYPFTSGPDYPSCVPIGQIVTCVGGYTVGSISQLIYQAPVTGGGIGAWVNATAYPTTIWAESCVAVGEHIACVGGQDTPSTVSSQVYVF